MTPASVAPDVDLDVLCERILSEPSPLARCRMLPALNAAFEFEIEAHGHDPATAYSLLGWKCAVLRSLFDVLEPGDPTWPAVERELNAANDARNRRMQ